jgi:hypothetical protein
MTRLAARAVKLILAGAMWGATSNTAKLEVVDTINGRHYLAVQAAVQELARRNLNVVGYKITVMREVNTIVVTFTDEFAPAGVRGSGGVKPGVEVELDANDLRVLRSNFLR